MCYKNQMPCIRIKEVYQTTKHVIEGIELNCTVEELKKIAAEKTNIPVEDQNCIFAGELLQDEKTLASYGIQDGFTVYVVKKWPDPELLDLDPDDVPIAEVMPILEAAIKSHSYRNTVSKILTNPDMLEQLIVTTPGLSADPVAMTLLQDPELLEQLVETANVETVVQEHPSLIQAASYIAAAIAKEGGERPPSRRNHRAVVDDYESDEELQGMEPGLVAQAELVAANEERIQSSRSSSSSSGPSSGSAAAHQQITSSLLSSALASAGIPQASTSRSHNLSSPGPSTSSGTSTSRQTITRDMVREAMASARSVAHTSSQMQSQLQQLRDIGITDDALSLQALSATGGDVQAALELIFEGL